MELRQIRYAVAVHECGNITRAAAQERVSQPTLTQALKRLEDDLGAPLFVRDRAGSRPTSLGAKMLPMFKEILTQAKDAAEAAEMHVKLKQVPVRFGIADSLGFGFLSEAFGVFQKAHPDIEIEFTVLAAADLLEGLLDATLDLGAGSLHDFQRDDLRIDPIYSEKYCLACHKDHPLADMQLIEVAELAGQVLLDRPNCEMRDRLLTKLEEEEIGLYANLRANSYPWMLSQVQMNAGIAIVPESLAGDAPCDVRFRDLDGILLRRQIVLVRSALQPTHAMTDTLIASTRKHLKCRLDVA